MDDEWRQDYSIIPIRSLAANCLREPHDDFLFRCRIIQTFAGGAWAHGSLISKLNARKMPLKDKQSEADSSKPVGPFSCGKKPLASTSTLPRCGPITKGPPRPFRAGKNAAEVTMMSTMKKQVEARPLICTHDGCRLSSK